jgi:hypothetical protein
MARSKNKGTTRSKRVHSISTHQISPHLYYLPQNLLSPCTDVESVRKIATTSEHFQPPIELFVVINMSTGTSNVCHHCIKYQSFDKANESIFEFTCVANSLVKYVCLESSLKSSSPPFALVRFKPTHKPLKLQQYVNQVALFTNKEYQYVELRTLLGKRLVLSVLSITGKAIIGILMNENNKCIEKIAVSFDEIVWIEAHKTCSEAFESIQKKIEKIQLLKEIPKLPEIQRHKDA